MVQSGPSGFVLAGGRSSRMGQDKALLDLGGRPLIARAVEKLQQVCSEVSILSSRPELAPYGPLIADVHPGCGPLSGIEAGLLHATSAWSLFLAVDVPFVPVALLQQWVARVVPLRGARMALFRDDGVLQPTVCLLHRDLLPFVEGAIGQGEYRLQSVLQQAAQELALRAGLSVSELLIIDAAVDAAAFANVNTPEDLARARLYQES